MYKRQEKEEEQAPEPPKSATQLKPAPKREPEKVLNEGGGLISPRRPAPDQDETMAPKGQEAEDISADDEQFQQTYIIQRFYKDNITLVVVQEDTIKGRVRRDKFEKLIEFKKPSPMNSSDDKSTTPRTTGEHSR